MLLSDKVFKMLTWKDLITTIFAIAIVWIFYSVTAGSGIPLISGFRSFILTFAVIGIVMCTLSGADKLDKTKNKLYFLIASVLGISILVTIIYGLIFGTKLAFTVLTVQLLLFWAISTARHLISTV